VPSLVCPDEERGIQLNYSFRAGRHGFRVNPDRIHPERICEGRASGCVLIPGVTNVHFGPFPTGSRKATFAMGLVLPSPFLTGSASQTESSVTHSKQTTATFLTGSRIAQLAFSNLRVLAFQNLMSHRRPIQIFLRPTI
jgi:hypothetical protein